MVRRDPLRPRRYHGCPGWRATNWSRNERYAKNLQFQVVIGI
jgi:hypothetical protein